MTTTTNQRPTVEAPEAGDPRLDADVTNVDIAHLSHVLLGHYPELRLAARKLMADERFHRIEGQSLADHRERVLGQLRLLAAEGDVHRSFPERFGGFEDHGGFLARFEELTHADPSLQIKSGVQWGLFASAIYHLGTERNHDEFLADALSVKVPGAFAMTETGHGSDVAAIGTTATYDPRRRSSSSTRRSARRGRTTSATPASTARRPPSSPGWSPPGSTTACTRSTSRSATRTRSSSSRASAVRTTGSRAV